MNSITHTVTRVNFIRTVAAQPALRDEATAAMRARAYDLRSLGTLLNSQAADFWQIGNSDTCVGRKCQEEAQKLHAESNARLDDADALLRAIAFCDLKQDAAALVAAWMDEIEQEKLQEQENIEWQQMITMQFSDESIAAR